MFAKLSNTKKSDTILNPHLDWEYSGEAMLQSEMIKEAIFNRGIEVRYIRRSMNRPDFIFGEDISNEFTDAFRISVYLETFDKFSGQGDVFSNFGYQIKDEAEFIVHIDQFKAQVDGEEPLEGDLVYFPLARALFEIKFSEDEDIFYQFGKNPIRRLVCQKFTYSHEEVSGDVELEDGTIDIIEELKNLNQLSEFEYEETRQVEREDTFVEFDPSNPFGNGYGDVK